MEMELDYLAERDKSNKDRRIAGIVAISSFVSLMLILHFLGYTIPTPPLPAQLLYKDAELELIPLEDIVYDEGTGGGGSGTPTNAPVDQNTPQMQQVLTQHSSTTHHASGNSNHTNTNTPTNNPPSAQNHSTNPFGGTGGSGGGSGSGNGSGVGNYDGSGSGAGNGNGSGGAIKRTIVQKPNSSNINSDENGKVVLKVNVNENGDVVGTPTVIRDKTSIEDISVINQVISLVKSQAKWNKAPGAAVFSTAITVSLTAN